MTKQQVTRLEKVFSYFDQKPKAKHCKGVEGLLQEGAESLREEDKSPLRDLQLIGAAQRVEHYEVAAYGTARAMAEKLGLSEAAALLSETLEEEERADKTLTQVAESLYSAVETGEVEEEESMPAVRKAGGGRAR